MEKTDIDTFLKIEIRVGRVKRAEMFKEAIKPAIKLWIDFGPDLGLMQSSAQITDNYHVENLVGKLIVAVINFPPKRIASFKSEVLVLGVSGSNGVVLISPDQEISEGERVH